MFKKSNIEGDRTPKQENKDPAAEDANADGKPAPADEKTAPPANGAEKS